MKRYNIPATDLEVSALCFGTSSLGTGLKGNDADRLISSFIEAGGCFFDTAHCYSFWEKDGYGASERELGECLRRIGYWGKVVVATKGGHPDAGEGYRRPDFYLADDVIISDIDDSLERLQAERIDLYFLHRDDSRVPVSDIIGVLNSEIERGRLRYIGASNWSIKRIAEANEYAKKSGLHGFVTSEVQWSLSQPDWKIGADPVMRYITEEDRKWYESVHIPIMAYSSTAGGYFARSQDGLSDGTINSKRKKRAVELANKLNCTPTQVALAYLLHQKPLTIPIFRTTKQSHLDEILSSVSVKLSGNQVRWLRDG